MRLIREADGESDRAAFAANCREYVDWCRARYADRLDLVDSFFAHQDLATELIELATKYTPPNGRILLVERDGAIVGGGAYRHFDSLTCELKRVYLSEQGRGRGAGRDLVTRLIETARADGYRRILLDTGKRLVEAIGLYESLGFQHTEPYEDMPEELAGDLVWMELILS